MSHNQQPEDASTDLQQTDLVASPKWNERTLRHEEMSALFQESAHRKGPSPVPVSPGQPSGHSLTRIDPTMSSWQHRTLRADEVATLSRLDLDETAATAATPTAPMPPVIQLRVEKTPAEFSRLYAALERQASGLDEVTLLNGETLGSERPYVLGITSAVRGEGKTTTALHLAMTIARDTFKKVCLIDMSMGKGDLGARLGVPVTGEGVVAVLEDSNNVVPTLQLAGCENLVIIPSGKAPENPARLARSPRVAQLIVSARYAFDIVIIDMPSVDSDNAMPLARHLDKVMMVTRAGATPQDVIIRALDVLGRDKVAGVALNRVKSATPAWLRKRFAKA